MKFRVPSFPSLAAALVGLPFLAVAACGGDAAGLLPPESSEGDAGAEAQGDAHRADGSRAEPSGDGGAPTQGDGGTDPGKEGGSTPAVVRRGTISVGQAFVDGQNHVLAGADFFVDDTTACTSTQVAGCSVRTCSAALLKPDAGVDAGRLIAKSAGNIHIVGGKVPAPGALLYYSVDHYSTISGTMTWFAPGDAFTATAAGADVPAFTTPSVNAPADVTITAPVCEKIECPIVTIDRSVDLDVTWTGGNASQLDASLLSDAVGVGSVSVTCRFNALDGHGVVPKEALAKLYPVVALGTSGVLIFTPLNEATFGAGDWQVAFQLSGTSTSKTYIDK